MCQSWLDTYERDNSFFLTIDLETQGLFPKNKRILLYAVSWDGHCALVFSPWNFKLDKFKEVLSTIPVSNHNCLQGDTLVITERGFMKISDIVNERLNVRILSFNTEKPGYQWSKITNYWNNGTKKNWLRVVFEYFPYHIIATGDHKFYYLDGDKLKKKSLREFKNGDEIILHSKEGLGTLPIKTIDNYSPLDKVGYDLEIEGNHNYIANNILVSNCKFDAKFILWETDIEIQICFDTMVATQMGYAGCFPGVGKKFSLDNVVSNLLPGYKISKAVRNEFIDKEIGTPFTEEQISYAACDVLTTHRLVYPLKKRLHNEGLAKLFEEVELPDIALQVQTELDGVTVDLPVLEAMYDQKMIELGNLLEEIRKEVEKFPAKQQPKYKKGDRFNPKSPSQVVDLMGQCYDYRMTSTDKDGMVKALTETKQPIVQKIITFRDLFDQVHKQMQGWLNEEIDRSDNTLHPNTNTYGTNSGRESQNEPNLMQVRKDQRGVLMARPGNLLIKSDYSSYEFRACAAQTGEPYLIQIYDDRAALLPVIKQLAEAYNQGDDPEGFIKKVKKGAIQVASDELALVKEFDSTDIHRRNTALILGKEINDVLPNERDGIGKTLGYAALYGGAAHMVQSKLAQAGFFYEIPKCEKLLDTFYDKLPRVKDCVDETYRQVEEQGWVETMLGRKLYFDLGPKWRRKEYQTRLSEAQRAAINFRFQGNNADAVKYAKRYLWEAHKDLYDPSIRPKLVLSVHDELVYDTPIELVHATKLRIEEMMVRAGQEATMYKVPMETATKVSRNWSK